MSTPQTTAFGVWQSIETAPRDGTWILLYDPMTSALIYSGCYDARFDSKWDPEKDEMEYVGQWTNYHVESFGYEEHQILAPTHWMPLPPPPQD